MLDSSKNILSSVGGYYDTHLITTSSTTAYIGLSIAMHEGVDDLNTIQLEKGSKANSYTPYGTTPIEVGGKGDYEDEFFKNIVDSEYYDSTLELDKWYLKKRTGKVVLDGSENLRKSSSTAIDRFLYDGSNIYGRAKIYSNLFENKSSYTQETTTIGTCYTNTNQIVFNYSSYGTTTLEQFKEWLSTHNTIVYYVLATPTNTLLNDTLQETLDSFYSWQEQTNISQENNDKPFVIKASALVPIQNYPSGNEVEY